MLFPRAVDILFITVRSSEDRDHKTEIKSVMGRRAKPEVVLLSAKVAQLTRSLVPECYVFRNEPRSLMPFFPDLFFDSLPFWISSFFSCFLHTFFFISFSFFPPVFMYSLFLTLISFSFFYLSFLNLSFLIVPCSLYLSILFFIFPLLCTLFLFSLCILYFLGAGLPQSVY